MAGFNTNALMPTPLPQQTNPLEFASQAIGVRNALLGNKIRQSEYDARNALGSAYANHFNALTGEYDIPAVQSELGSTAAGRLALPEAVTTLGSQKTQRIGNENAELALNQRRAGMIAGIAAPYLKKEGLTKGDLAPAYGTAVAHGLMSLDQAQQSYASLPEGGDALKQQVRGLTDAAIGPEHAYNDAYGSMQLVDVGGHLQWQNVGSAASGQGGVSTGAPIGKTLSPSEATAPQPYNDAAGNPKIATRADVVRANGQSQYLDGPSKPTVPLSVMGDGSYPGQPGSATETQPGGFAAGPAPGQVEGQRAAAEVTGRAAGEQFGQAGQLSAGFGDRMYRSQKALQLLQEIAPASGKPAELHNRIVNVAVSLGMTTPSDKAAAYDEANKYLTQLAASQPGAAHSDAQLATALAGNPSTHINNLAAQDALRANIALDRRANAAYLAFHQQYPGTAAQVHANEWAAFQNDYTTKKDARAFMFDIMSPEQRSRLWSGMDGKQRQAFRSELRSAMATGLVQAPN